MLPLHLFNSRVVINGNMAGNITSEVVNLNEAVSYAVQIVWSGTAPVGSLDLEGSNDNTTFTSVLSSPIAISGNTGSLMVNVEKHAYGFARLVYTFTSGTGTLNISVNAKRG